MCQTSSKCNPLSIEKNILSLKHAEIHPLSARNSQYCVIVYEHCKHMVSVLCKMKVISQSSCVNNKQQFFSI